MDCSIAVLYIQQLLKSSEQRLSCFVPSMKVVALFPSDTQMNAQVLKEQQQVCPEVKQSFAFGILLILFLGILCI